jgi:hypothetical protein
MAKLQCTSSLNMNNQFKYFCGIFSVIVFFITGCISEEHIYTVKQKYIGKYRLDLVEHSQTSLFGSNSHNYYYELHKKRIFGEYKQMYLLSSCDSARCDITFGKFNRKDIWIEKFAFDTCNNKVAKIHRFRSKHK